MMIWREVESFQHWVWVEDKGSLWIISPNIEFLLKILCFQDQFIHHVVDL